jgi:hypothetical protein
VIDVARVVEQPVNVMLSLPGQLATTSGPLRIGGNSPSIPYGVSTLAIGWSGTVSLSPSTLRRLVVKVGTGLITTPSTGPDRRRIAALAADIAAARADGGRDVVLVTSGAIATGMARLALPERPRTMPEKVAAEVRSILDRFESSPLAKRLASLEVIGCEIPLLHADEDGTLWRGSIDLLARDAEGTLVVIDYKTDAELDGAALRHTEQLSVYARAVRRATPAGACRAELWMLRHGEIVPIEL